MSPSPFPLTTAEFNPWFACAVELTLRFVLLGAAWAWLFLPDKEKSGRGLARAGVFSILIGVLFTALSTVLLGELGIFRRWLDLSLSLAFAAAGIGLGIRQNAKALGRALLSAAPAAALFFTGTAAIMLAPAQGEWIKGGWDPGVYVNAGTSLSLNSTFYPEDSFFNRLIPPEDQKLFLRFAGRRTERFPGLMQNGDRQSLHFHFFRLTPALIAAAHRAGGLRAALRTNAFLGLCALLCFAFALCLTTGTGFALCAAALLMMQPVFLYHTHTPVAEMAELLILCATLAFFAPESEDTKHRVLLAFALFALVLNKLSFLPFGAILLFALTCRNAQDAGPAKNYLPAAFGLALGLTADLLTSPDSARGWKIFPLLLAVSAFFLALAFILPALRSKKTFARINALANDYSARIVFCTALLCAAVMFALPYIRPESEDAANLIRLVRYTGWPLFLLAVGGGAALAFNPGKAGSCLKPAVFFLLCVTFIVLVRKNIVNVYPWATRRYLTCALPLLALCAAAGLMFVRERIAAAAPVLSRGFVPAALLSVFALVLPMDAAALTRVEADGLSAELGRIAAFVDEDDIVLCDHFSWATPLACIFGKQVLNGERILSRHGPDKAARAFARLRELAAEGKRVRLLTSTSQNLSVYPLPLPDAVLDRKFRQVIFQRLRHHRNLAGFESEDESPDFKLWSLEAAETA